MPFTLAQAGSGRLTWSSKPDSGLCGWLVLTKAVPERSQRKHCLSTSVKPDILTRAILAFSARDNTEDVIRERSLQFEGLRHISQEPQINFSRRIRITRMAFGWIGATTAFASVVRKPNSSCCPSTGALFGARTPRQGVQRPVKANKGRSWPRANHFGVLRGLVSAYSQNEVAGTMQRFCWPSHSRASAGCQHCEYW
jgi:hypothetical protein